MDLPLKDINYLYYLAICESKQRQLDEEKRKQEEFKKSGKSDGGIRVPHGAPPPPMKTPSLGGIDMEDLEEVLSEGG